MAKRLPDYDFSRPSAVTPSGIKGRRYPWDQWLDGDIWQLTHGADFDVHPQVLERIIRNQVTKRKGKVQLRHLTPFEATEPAVIVLQRTDVPRPARKKRLVKKLSKFPSRPAPPARVQLNTRVQAHTVERLKHQARIRGVSVNELVEASLSEHLGAWELEDLIAF